MQLRVKLLNENAKMPTLGHEGDLGYDVFASEDVALTPGSVYKVPTGIAVEAKNWVGLDNSFITTPQPLGLIVKDRSSMAAKGVLTHGGVIDSGYRGEVIILMTYVRPAEHTYVICKGDKIAQLVPVPVLTSAPTQIEEFSETSRGSSGFGSTGA